MRFLFISRRGAGLSLATRVSDEGHKVYFFVNNLLYKVLGNGIVEKAKTGEFNHSDIVVFDEAGMGEYASTMAKTRNVIGSSIFADTFNSNIDYKGKVLAKCNLKLESFKGEELYITGWFNGFSFVRPFHSYFKKTKFMENNLGIDTECMGCLLWYHRSNRIVKNTIVHMTNELKKTGYIGAVNLRLAVEQDNIHITDATMGFTYDDTYAALEGIRQEYGEMLYRLTFDSMKQVKASTDWLVATRVTIPPYPLPMSEKLDNPIPIGGINDNNLKHLWLRDVYKEDNQYYSAGCDGFLMTVTARGLTPSKAIRRTHRTIHNLQIENVQYRRDIIEGMEDKYKKIKEWGWI